ncbi:MAG: DUF5618 family protein [Bacteroidales bacterium]|nr:DUF5618 family protein [Bacteroidales bacterium]
MKESSNIEVVENPVEEARRYVQNAKDLLNERGKLDIETQLYKDRKYVRMAGNTLWNGVLLIVDAVFHLKSKERPHPDVIDYRNAISNRDKKLLSLFVTGYEMMHISMGYDGSQSKVACQEGFRLANDIIDRCAAMLPSQVPLGAEHG